MYSSNTTTASTNKPSKRCFWHAVQQSISIKISTRRIGMRPQVPVDPGFIPEDLVVRTYFAEGEQLKSYLDNTSVLQNESPWTCPRAFGGPESSSRGVLMYAAFFSCTRMP